MEKKERLKLWRFVDTSKRNREIFWLYRWETMLCVISWFTGFLFPLHNVRSVQSEILVSHKGVVVWNFIIFIYLLMVKDKTIRILYYFFYTIIHTIYVTFENVLSINFLCIQNSCLCVLLVYYVLLMRKKEGMFYFYRKEKYLLWNLSLFSRLVGGACFNSKLGWIYGCFERLEKHLGSIL